MELKKQYGKRRIQNPVTKEFENPYQVAILENNECKTVVLRTESGYEFPRDSSTFGFDDIRFLFKSEQELREVGFGD